VLHKSRITYVFMLLEYIK